MILQVSKQTAFFHDFRFMTLSFLFLNVNLFLKQDSFVGLCGVVSKYFLSHLVLFLPHLVRGSSPKPVFRTTNFTAVGNTTINLTNCGADKFVLNQVGENIDFSIFFDLIQV